MGLKWSAVDFDGGRVRVSQALTRTGVPGWKLVEPKTRKARRTVPLPSITVQALPEWRKKTAEERLLAGRAKQSILDIAI